MQILKKILMASGVLAVWLPISYLAAPVLADPLVSPHYTFTEQSLGASGSVGAQSANYMSDSAIGILGLGNSASTSLLINAGNITTGDPSLAFAVDTGSVSFGTFSAGAASTATAVFEVLDYTSYGYVVQILGLPPTHNSHTITAMASTGTSTAGIEQFGINVVANTSPVSLGANPDNGQFGFGQAAPNYATSNNYRYVSGETIALGPKSSGNTIYTISYIVNVNALTPAGVYSGGQTLLCTGTY